MMAARNKFMYIWIKNYCFGGFRQVALIIEWSITTMAFKIFCALVDYTFFNWNKSEDISELKICVKIHIYFSVMYGSYIMFG